MATALQEDPDPGDVTTYSEIEQVDEWRDKCLDRMGFSETEIAILLLHPEVDLGSIRNLLLRGATHDQCVRILV